MVCVRNFALRQTIVCEILDFIWEGNFSKKKTFEATLAQKIFTTKRKISALSQNPEKIKFRTQKNLNAQHPEFKKSRTTQNLEKLKISNDSKSRKFLKLETSSKDSQINFPSTKYWSTKHKQRIRHCQ